MGEAVGLAATAGLGLPAAVAVASAAYCAEHGVVFYFYFPFYSRFHDVLGSRSVAIWIVVAAVWSIAFAVGVQGRWRVAAGFSVAGGAYGAAVTVMAGVK